jgi:hypothetical protein
MCAKAAENRMHVDALTLSMIDLEDIATLAVENGRRMEWDKKVFYYRGRDMTISPITKSDYGGLRK